MLQIPRRKPTLEEKTWCNMIYLHFEALCAVEHVCDLKWKLQWIGSGHVVLISNSYPAFCVANINHENWTYIALKPGGTLLYCFHMVVVKYHILLKEISHLWKHNLNSSTRPIWVWKVSHWYFQQVVDMIGYPWCSAISRFQQKSTTQTDANILFVDSWLWKNMQC